VLGEFMERLPEELGASTPPANRQGFSAADGDGSDPAELLDVASRGKAVAVRAEGGQQARRHGGAGSRQLEQGGVGVLSHELR